MKKKHKNGCNILIITISNLEKYVYSKKCLKQRRRKSLLATAVILGRPAPFPNKVCDWLGKQ